MTRPGQGSGGGGVTDSVNPEAAPAVSGLRQFLPPLRLLLQQGDGEKVEVLFTTTPVLLIPRSSPSLCPGGTCLGHRGWHRVLPAEADQKLLWAFYRDHLDRPSKVLHSFPCVITVSLSFISQGRNIPSCEDSFIFNPVLPLSIPAPNPGLCRVYFCLAF